MHDISIRRIGTNVLLVVYMVLLGLLPVGLPLALIAEDGPRPMLLVPALGFGALLLVLVVRAARVRFAADSTGVTIRNLFRTRRLAWSDIAGLTTGLGAMLLQHKGGRVELHVILKSRACVKVTASGIASARFEQLVIELMPVMELASAHRVPTAWKNLSELEKLQVQRLMQASSAIGGAARVIS
ncbi:MAG: PH domain-containing protein [Kofleriaceae bacterium]